VLAEVGDADVWSWRGAVGGEDGDHLLPAQSLNSEVVANLAGEKAEGGVQLVGGEEACGRRCPRAGRPRHQGALG
jgi:hypothetical protein